MSLTILAITWQFLCLIPLWILRFSILWFFTFETSLKLKLSLVLTMIFKTKISEAFCSSVWIYPVPTLCLVTIFHKAFTFFSVGITWLSEFKICNNFSYTFYISSPYFRVILWIQMPNEFFRDYEYHSLGFTLRNSSHWWFLSSPGLEKSICLSLKLFAHKFKAF